MKLPVFNSLQINIALFLAILIGLAGCGKGESIADSPKEAFPITFELGSTAFNFIGFGGGSASIVANPDKTDNPSDQVLRYIKGTPEPFAGFFFDLPITLDETNGGVFTADVWSTQERSVLLKFENSSDNTKFAQITASHSGGGNWQTLTFDLSDLFNSSDELDRVVIIIDDGTVGDGSADWTFYIDNIAQAPATPQPLTLTVTADSATSVGITGPFWGWDINNGPSAEDNGDGTWTVSLDPAPTEDMEYLWIADGVQENLLDNSPLDLSCTPVTNGSTYANRQWLVGSANVTGEFYDSCTDPASSTTADPGTTPDHLLYALSGNADDDPDTFNSVQDFGNGATFDAEFSGDTSFNRVFAITSGEGYGPDVHVAFVAFDGYVAGFASAYDSFSAKVKNSPDGTVEVKLIGSGTDSAVIIDLATYSGSTNLGDGWYELNIPFTDFSNSDSSNISAHNGWLIGPPGDQADETFTFYFTDAGFNSSKADPGTTPDHLLYALAGSAFDDPETFNSVQNYGNGATFDAEFSTDYSFDRVFEITSGEGYGPEVHVAFVAFDGYTAGFASAYDTFEAKVKGSPDNTVEIKLIGSGTDSVVVVDVTSYAGSTELGDGWYELSIPYNDFSNSGSGNISAHSGWLIGPPGDQADSTFKFYFTDAGFSSSL